MYASVCPKEHWHRHGDLFLRVVTGKHNEKKQFEYGRVIWLENADALSISWNKIVSGRWSKVGTVAFNETDFREIHLLDQKFSLGEIAFDDRTKRFGEVVGLHLEATVLVHNTTCVTFNRIPLNLLKPKVILDEGKILLSGWLGEINRKYWNIYYRDGEEVKVLTDEQFPEAESGRSKYYQTIIPIVGDDFVLEKKKYEIVDVQLSALKVRWYHKLKHYAGVTSEEPPPQKIEDPKRLSEFVEVDAVYYNNICKVETLCHYTIRDVDTFVDLRNWQMKVFDDILGFDYKISKAKKRKKRRPFSVGDTVLVNILRTYNVLDVEWQGPNGQLIRERVRAKDVRHQERFKYPKTGYFRQLVTLKQVPGLPDQVNKRLGITMARNHPNNSVLVQWLREPGEVFSLVEESEFDLMTHKDFGTLHVGQLVERSDKCPPCSLTVGVIEEILKDGYFIISTDITGETTVKLSPEEFLICPSISKVGYSQMRHNLKLQLNDIWTANNDPKSMPVFPKEFYKAIERDWKLTEQYRDKTHSGIRIQSTRYTNRCSAIIFGPENTVYEDGVFLFEFYFPYDYPNNPPSIQMSTPFQTQISVHFGRDGQLVRRANHISFHNLLDSESNELKFTRKVNDTMVPYPVPFLWNATVTLEDLVLSIKHFVFVEEPFLHSYRDWDDEWTSFDIQRIKSLRREAMKAYNSNVIIEMYDSLLFLNSQEYTDVWKEIILTHLKTTIPKMAKRLKSWMEAPSFEKLTPELRPKFQLFPLSKGTTASLERRLNLYPNFSPENGCRTSSSPQTVP